MGSLRRKAGKIWYVTLTERLTGIAGFEECARETVSVARDLFPEDTSIATKVAQAWTDVGVLNSAPATAVFESKSAIHSWAAVRIAGRSRT